MFTILVSFSALVSVALTVQQVVPFHLRILLTFVFPTHACAGQNHLGIGNRFPNYQRLAKWQGIW
jgi:hypothetical protein